MSILQNLTIIIYCIALYDTVKYSVILRGFVFSGYNFNRGMSALSDFLLGDKRTIYIYITVL